MAETLVMHTPFMRFLFNIQNIDLNYKNDSELTNLMTNLQYINQFILEKMDIDLKNDLVKITFIQENVVKITMKDDSFELHIMDEYDIKQYMIEHFDDFFNLSHFTSSFIFNYFLDKKNTKIHFPTLSFVKRFMEHFCDDFDLHLMLKDGIRNIDQFVDDVLDLDGISHFWMDREEFYHNEDDNIYVIKIYEN